MSYATRLNDRMKIARRIVTHFRGQDDLSESWDGNVLYVFDALSDFRNLVLKETAPENGIEREGEGN